MIDLQEGRHHVPILDDERALDLLAHARRIAIVGASPDRMRPSNSVMRYLMHHGYECIPINPFARDVLGMRAYGAVTEAADAGGPFDVVDVFRRPEFTPDIAREAVVSGAGALWLQLGVVSWEAARIAHEGGLDVVMDRCTAIVHRRLATRAR